VRVLVVAAELPNMPYTGMHTRPLSLIRALSAHHEVICVGTLPHGGDDTELQELCTTVESVRQPVAARSPYRAALSSMRALATPVPLISQADDSVLTRLVDQAVLRHRPDAVQLEAMYTIHCRLPGLPTVLDLYDIVSSLCTSARRARPMRYALAGLQARVVARAEARLLRDVLPVTINDADRETLAARGIAAFTIPLAVIPPTSVAPLSSDDRLELLFVGAFEQPGNAAAIRFLTRCLLPQLRRRDMPVRLTIAGRTTRPVPPSSPPDLVFEANVADLAPLYARAQAVVVPLAHGGGTKNKTLEAMVWGRPVLATAPAMTGITAVDGRDYLRVPLDAAAIADVLARLASDPALCQRLGSAARRYVSEAHSQDLVARRVRALYQALANGGGVPLAEQLATSAEGS
jgi:polysaccharide biosynthesis protein PslH